MVDCETTETGCAVESRAPARNIASMWRKATNSSTDPAIGYANDEEGALTVAN